MPIILLLQFINNCIVALLVVIVFIIGSITLVCYTCVGLYSAINVTEEPCIYVGYIALKSCRFYNLLCVTRKQYCVTGYIAPWSGRFYSLWDTGYAKIHIPIIASVSEHQPTTWVSFFFDLHVLICMFPAGVWFVTKEINDERVFSE